MQFYTHPVCLQHDAGPGHPESPARLASVIAALDSAFPDMHWREAPIASQSVLQRAHHPALLRDLLDRPVPHHRQIDADTGMNSASAEAALRAAGAVCAAIDAVMEDRTQRAFCAVRPPGHHATHAQAMGFCLFNSIAVGVMHALEQHGLQRVAVVDFDVHHGNGTQDILWDEPRALYLSSHQHPLYPGTGDPRETGGRGHIVNIPLPEGCDSTTFRHAYQQHALPVLEAYAPQLILISAGFDAHRLDPLAGLNLDANDYEWVTRALVDIAERHCHGRVVSALEGGYSLTALREASVAHCRALL